MRALSLLLVISAYVSYPSAHAKDRGALIPTPIHANPCVQALTAKYFPRGTNIETPQINDPVSMAKSTLNMQAWNWVRTFFSQKWDTQVFFTATAVPDANTFEIPLIDPDAKAVVVFFHGSGTSKSSGSNYVMNMSTLANLGYASVSIDLPFHGAGPLSEKYYSSDDFMEWLRKIIEDIKASGKPVYLAGHSFGPDIVFEFLSRYPNLVSGGTAISPAAFNPTLVDWYEQYTTRMKFGGNVAENPSGGRWASQVIRGFGWNNGSRPDPTLVNPDLKLRILSGDREEYVPAPIGGPNRTPIGPNTYDIKPVLQAFFQGAEITIEKGVGHYLFDFRDERGLNIVQRELLTMLGEDPTNATAIANAVGHFRNKRTPSEKLAYITVFDLPFRAWFLNKYSERLAQTLLINRNDVYAKAIIEEYEMNGRAELSRLLMKAINATATTHPDFYAANIDRINESNARNNADGSLIALYFRAVNGGHSVTTNE